MKFFIFLIMVVCNALFIPTIAFGAQVYFEPKAVASPQDQPYTVTVVLNTNAESINTVEGTLKVDPALGEVISVTDSGSIVTHWVERPMWNAALRTIQFSGAIPGGYAGSAGILFSVVLPSYTGPEIPNALLLSGIQALRNDGLGSSARIGTQSFDVGKSNAQVDGAIIEQLYAMDNRTDNTPPEVFNPQLAKDDRVFDGKWFITFSTTDKQSGIDHYEIQESRSGSVDAGKWQRAESPFVLQDQALHSFIYVIAIDRQGNERMIKVFPRNPLPWYSQYRYPALGAGIVIVGIAGYMIVRMYKNKKQHV